MKKILITTDFSPAAENAVEYGVEMALALKADIILLHVYQSPVAVFDVPIIIDHESLKKDAEKQISLLKIKLENKVNNNVQVHVEECTGLFFHELEKVCEKDKPYMVVMGSQGTTASDRIFYGSETIRALKYLKWPLLTVPTGAKFSSIKKIGLSCDLEKEIDGDIIGKIEILLDELKAELHVINAGNAQQFKPEVVFESSVLMRKLSKHKPNFHFITAANIENDIIAFAESKGIDLLIILPQHHSFLDLLMKGRVSKKIILRSHIPVLSIHQ